jgi:hypothetical protein
MIAASPPHAKIVSKNIVTIALMLFILQKNSKTTNPLILQKL